MQYNSTLPQPNPFAVYKTFGTEFHRSFPNKAPSGGALSTNPSIKINPMPILEKQRLTPSIENTGIRKGRIIRPTSAIIVKQQPKTHISIFSKPLSSKSSKTTRCSKNAFESYSGIEAFSMTWRNRKISWAQGKGEGMVKSQGSLYSPELKKHDINKSVVKRKRSDDLLGSSLTEEEMPSKVYLLKSIYSGRKPTVFFPYLPCCLEERSSDRVISLETKTNLKYKLTDSIYAYNCVINSLKNAGLTETEHNDWNLLWSAPLKLSAMRNVNKHQKCNHFPKTWQLGGKDNLWKNVSRLRRKFGDQYDICPQTFILPEDFKRLAAERESNPKALWILKPVASSCGRGIKIIARNKNLYKKHGYLVSRYISNPHLINGHKYDLRVYVLVTSFDPLRIYMYDNGLVRFATEPYTTSVKHCKDRCVHLTNYAVNKKAVGFIKTQSPEEDGVGSKWSFNAYRCKLAELGINPAGLFAKIKDVVIKACIAAEPAIFTGLSRATTHRDVCFELYGFDILIDENIKPWLLEVNVSPSLSSSSPLDKTIKTKLMCDVFNIIGLRPKETPKRIKLTRPKQLKRKNVNELLGLKDFTKLDKEDIEILLYSEEELYRRGHFERIFPEVHNIDYYGKFFENMRYNNILLWRWMKSKVNFLERMFRKECYTNC